MRNYTDSTMMLILSLIQNWQAKMAGTY